MKIHLHRSLFLLLSFLLISIPLLAQENNQVILGKETFKLHEKGKFYINWGYNRSWFNKSDIHFRGQGYDFVLYDVVAKDRPTNLSLDYINPKWWSSPQFNLRVGYFISDKYSISIGWDHMKYVAQDFQTVRMYGYVNPEFVADPLMKANMTALNTKYNTPGVYNDSPVDMTPDDFIHYEHTDGLNYGSLEVERYDKIFQLKNHDKIGLSLVTGLGAGLIIPRTDAHLFGSGRNHFWNVSGWGTSAKIGLQFNFLKHFYLQSDFKYGRLQMIEVHTSNHYGIDNAQQHIIFYENYWQLGYRF